MNLLRRPSQPYVLRGVAALLVLGFALVACLLLARPSMPATVWVPRSSDIDGFSPPWIAATPGGPWLRCPVDVVRIIESPTEHGPERWLDARYKAFYLRGPQWSAWLPLGVQDAIARLQVELRPVTYRVTGRSVAALDREWLECREE